MYQLDEPSAGPEMISGVRASSIRMESTSSTTAYAKNLAVNAHADVLQRSRGIFRVNVFRAHATMTGDVPNESPASNGERCGQGRAVIFIRGQQASSTVASRAELENESSGSALPRNARASRQQVRRTIDNSHPEKAPTARSDAILR